MDNVGSFRLSGQKSLNKKSDLVKMDFRVEKSEGTGIYIILTQEKTEIKFDIDSP